jgi:hypothetical protein
VKQGLSDDQMVELIKREFAAGPERARSSGDEE